MSFVSGCYNKITIILHISHILTSTFPWAFEVRNFDFQSMPTVGMYGSQYEWSISWNNRPVLPTYWFPINIISSSVLISSSSSTIFTSIARLYVFLCRFSFTELFIIPTIKIHMKYLKETFVCSEFFVAKSKSIAA